MKVRIALTAALALFVGGINLHSQQAPQKPVFKIGVIAPLTGDNAILGEDMREGTTLAIEELKDKLSFEIKPIYEDDRLENRLTNQAALKLIELDKVDMLFTLWTPSASLIGPRCEKAHVIQFNTSWDAAPTQRFHWTLMHGATYQDFAEKIVNVIKMHHPKRVAIASNVELGINLCNDYAKPLIKEAGIQIVFDDQYNPGDLDLRMYFLKLRESKPDFIWTNNNPPGDIIFLKAQAQLGKKLPSTGNYDYMRPEYESLERLIEGDIFPSGLYTTPDFNKRFTMRFGHPQHMRAAHFYDMVNITADAINSLYRKLERMPTHEELLAELKRPKELPNLAVGPGRMTPSGWVESHYVLRQIKNGKVVEYQGGQ